MPDTLDIEAAAVASPEVVEAVRRLVPQLATGVLPSADQLQDVVSSPGTTLLLARDRSEGGRIVGMLALVVFRVPSGVHAWIEDVVVDSPARERGTGEALSREAIRLAAERGAQSVDLTSRPERTAANRLYERIGFQRRDTNVYRYTLAGPPAT